MPKLLAVDLDGTLFYPKRRQTLITNANVQFLRDLIDAGHRVIFVTSRNREFVEKTAARIERSVDAVCINGAQIILGGQLVRDETIHGERAFEIFAHMSRYDAQPLAWFLDNHRYQNLLFNNGVSWLTSQFFKYYYKSLGAYRQNYLADDDVFLSEIKKGDVYRMLMYFGIGKRRENIAKNVNKYMRETFPDIECSWIHTVVEIAPRDCHKAAALEYIIARESIARDDVYVVGDSGNDISMFQAFQKNSYCMDHAHNSVKKFAKHTIKRVHHLRAVILGDESHP